MSDLTALAERHHFDFYVRYQPSVSGDGPLWTIEIKNLVGVHVRKKQGVIAVYGLTATLDEAIADAVEGFGRDFEVL